MAKKKHYEQSLFEHSLIELDVVLQLLPILKQPNHLNLSKVEEDIVVVSLIAHDAGKERSEWQKYISGQRSYISDVDFDYTMQVLPELLEDMGFEGYDEWVVKVVRNCINLHMKHERSDTNVLVATLGTKERDTKRWLTLANLVYHIDNICSARGVPEARNAFKGSLLENHLITTYHQLVPRGVSTSLLHRAALESFMYQGWIPILHYSDATLYVCSADQPTTEPSIDQIERRLSEILKEATGKDVTQFIVGSPTADILPKPELFEYKEIRMYLEAAAHKVKRKSFLSAYERDKKKGLGQGDDGGKSGVIKQYWDLNGKVGEIYSSEMDRDAQRISEAHPDMVVFKFFKAAMRPQFIGREGTVVAAREYESIFGAGSWQNLISTSTLMAAKDMIKTVDCLWDLSGQLFGITVGTVEELAAEKRTELLIDILTGIADKVYESIPVPPTRASLATEMARALIEDLVSPTAKVNVTDLAIQQMKYYSASKQFAGKQSRKANYFCPICNTPFLSGAEAKADFVDKPESHTNRGIAHGAFNHINICNSCKYERILRQLLLGERASDLIVIFPRMNIGHSTGELLLNKAKALYEKAYIVMSGDSDDPDQRLWFAFTPFMAKQIFNIDLYRVKPEELINLITYRTGMEDARKKRSQLEKSLKNFYGDDLSIANDECGTDFLTWDEVVTAVHNNKVRDTDVKRIRAEVYKLGIKMQLICETPNMVILPLTYAIKFGDDSESNAALRTTFMALLLGMTLDATVAIVHDSDLINFHGGEGVAFVPPVSAVRTLIGANWVLLENAENWFRAIGVGSILAEAGQYSERSGLYEVLKSPTVGHILRRIEQKRETQRLSVTMQEIAYLKMFDSVMQKITI
ncbi:MAG: hypothetical protein ACYCVD_15665 [Desulfitobacteriaceae bacterium]